MSTGRLKNFFLNLVLFVLVTAVCIGAAEWTLKHTLFAFNAYAKSPGPGIPFMIETLEFKHSFVNNSDELRGPELPPIREEDFNVLCLGDSFTFGLGVEFEETYSQQLQKIFDSKRNGVHVINGGSGFAVRERYEYVRQRFDRLRPDHVFVQIYIGNDFYDGMIHKKDAAVETPQEGKAAERRRGPSATETIKEAFRQSYIMKLVWHVLIRFDAFDDLLFKMNLRNSERGIFLREYPALEKELVEFHMDYLERLRVYLKERGVDMTLLLVPAKSQIYQKKLLDNEKYDYKKPNRILSAYCAEKGIQCIDMLEIYETMPLESVRPLYYLQDMHWTVQGHAFTARVLDEWIEKEIL